MLRAHFDELLDGLTANEVYIDRFYFDRDPRVCFPPNPQEAPVRLRQLAGRYPEHRLLVVTGGEGLFDRRTGRMQAWVEVFSAWNRRALLTFEPQRSWRRRESRLAERFLLVPASIEGLTELILAVIGEGCISLAYSKSDHEVEAPRCNRRPVPRRSSDTTHASPASFQRGPPEPGRLGNYTNH